MVWNWQLPDWPAFTYNSDQLSQKERQFLSSSGRASAFLKNINETDRSQFIVEILSVEGIESSKIEGEFLERKSLQSSIRRHFGLHTRSEPVGDKETHLYGWIFLLTRYCKLKQIQSAVSIF